MKKKLITFLSALMVMTAINGCGAKSDDITVRWIKDLHFAFVFQTNI